MYLYKTVVLPDSKTDIQPSYALKVNPVNLYHNVCHFKNTVSYTHLTLPTKLEV